MPIRTNVGSGDGVTSASISPATSSTATSPTATETTARPCSASTCPRGPVARRDHRPAQPHAHRAGQEHRRQLQQPVRGEQAEHDVALACVEHQARDHAEVGGVLEQQIRDRDAEQDRERDAPGGHPRVVHPHLQRERARRVLAVVVGEVVVDQLVDLAGGSDGGLHLGIARHPQRDDRGRRRRTPPPCRPPPPAPVGDDRERHRPEPDELAPQRCVGAGDRRPGPGHQRRQPADQHRVAGRRPHHRQVGRHPLVEVDQFVDLGAGQPATPLDQLLEPVPGRAMGQHERVDIHAGKS